MGTMVFYLIFFTIICDPILENREYRVDIRFELQATLGRK